VKLNRRRGVLVVCLLLIAVGVIGAVALVLESVLVPSVMSSNAFTKGFVGLCILVTVVELFVPATRSQKRVRTWLYDRTTPNDESTPSGPERPSSP
jgi:uncharacterized membrane protein YeaQ/YmgE (transglycosylase-associated protein family)